MQGAEEGEDDHCLLQQPKLEGGRNYWIITVNWLYLLFNLDSLED